MEMEMVYRLAGLGVLFCLSAFFSGSETALLSMDPHRVRYLKNQGGKSAGKLAAILERPEKLLTGILVGNNLVNIALSVIAAGLFGSIFGAKGEIMTILILTPVLLIFSEIFPKTMAKQYSEKFSFTVLGPIRLVLFVLTPVIIAVGQVTKVMMRLVGGNDGDDKMSEDELQAIITHGSETGVLESSKADMLHGVFGLTETPISEVVISRVSVVALSIDATYEEVKALLASSPHSRFPVYGKTIDDIVGIFHAKDILKCEPEEFCVHSTIREPLFVPSTQPIGRLLQILREKRLHMALVVDEYGGFEGIVTIEDIIEEIVGEIDDEFDVLPQMTPSPAGGMLVSATAYLKDVNKALGCNIGNGEATTILGLLHEELERVPEAGDSVSVNGKTLSVAKMTGHRVEEVQIV